ncbi:MAG TPA: type II secretion system protein G, partial [Gallionella sp.]|nr:type II secretion system protein G [Gallionella sp.]
LRENLSLMREALDKYYGDNGAYPDTLDTLVSRRYLRNVPLDPMTGENSTWVTIPPDSAKGGVFDVKSGAEGTARDGSEFKDW